MSPPLNICRGDIPAEEILKDYSGFQKFRLKLIMRALSKKFKFSEAYFLENVKKIKTPGKHSRNLGWRIKDAELNGTNIKRRRC